MCVYTIMYMRACLSHTDLYVGIRERIIISNPAKVYPFYSIFSSMLVY